MLEYFSLVNPLFNYHLGANVSYFITISQAYSVHVLQPVIPQLLLPYGIQIITNADVQPPGLCSVTTQLQLEEW